MQLLPVVFEFLTAIEKNNNREWFNQNKDLYGSAFNNVQDFVSAVIEGISVFDVSVGSQEAKKCIYRIYRDIRFSPDKRPYKIHFGAYIAPQGKQSNNAGYYLHIQRGMSFIGGGLWCPESALLKKIREEIYYAPEELNQILENKNFKSVFGKLMDIESLKKPPRNYPADFEYINLLKYRHFCVERGVNNSETLAPDFLKKCIQTYQLIFPLVDYMNKLIKIKD
ncbi:MAG: DUF2461 domain-containing protein [Bacteroidales bacterium]|jgi:uncharacterized protein (TIGR02453 family)|nr:DUF2461 domain-containing protein [Bacteroidales bacterium]